MTQQTRAILGMFAYGAWILGLALIAPFVIRLVQHVLGYRPRMLFDREIVGLVSGIVFFCIGYISLKRVNRTYRSDK